MRCPLARLELDVECAAFSVCRPWLEDACTRCDGWWTIEAVEQMLADGTALLWVLVDDAHQIFAAVVTALADWDGRKVAEIVLTGGKQVIENLESELSAIERWAREAGAQEILFRGRRGWARLYKPLGYEEIAVTMRKAL